MSTLGLPYYFEDTTGLASGPTDFLDIYDRPPFLRLATTHHPRAPSRTPTAPTPRARAAAAAASASPASPPPPAPPGPAAAAAALAEPRTLKIFELAARTFITSRSPYAQQQHRGGAGAGAAQTPPSAVLALDAGRGIVGSVRFRGGTGVALERWLKKSSTFGSTLTRQFKASDGMYYQWSFRSVQDHEWACVQLATNHLVAHYDVRPPSEPVAIYRQTSGNVLTVQESCVHLSVELLASLIIMRHIRAQSSC